MRLFERLVPSPFDLAAVGRLGMPAASPPSDLAIAFVVGLGLAAWSPLFGNP